MFRHGCGNSEAQPFLGRSFPGDGFGFSGPSFYFRALIIFMVGVELDFFFFFFFLCCIRDGRERTRERERERERGREGE